MRSEEFVVLMFAAPHPPQRAGMQEDVGRQGHVNRSRLDYDAGDLCRLSRSRVGDCLCVLLYKDVRVHVYVRVLEDVHHDVLHANSVRSGTSTCTILEYPSA